MIKHLFQSSASLHSDLVPFWLKEEASYSLSHQVSSVRTLAIWTCPIYWLNLVATLTVECEALSS